jgi:hypothetical protein
MQSARANICATANHLHDQRSGAWGEAFQRQIWHPHWKRVEAEDAQMKISGWVSRKRKLMWMARFVAIGAEIAKQTVSPSGLGGQGRSRRRPRLGARIVIRHDRGL